MSKHKNEMLFNQFAWIIGTSVNGKLHVYETRSVTFCEEILVRNVEMLNAPDPPIFEQLLEKADALAGKTSAAGTEKSVVGDVARYQAEGLSSVEWDETDTISEITKRIQEIDLTDKDSETGTNPTDKDSELNGNSADKDSETGTNPTDKDSELNGKPVESISTVHQR